MSQQKGNGLVPELRFKKDDGSPFPDWKIMKLKTIAKRKISKNKDEKITRVLTNSAVSGVVDQRDYFDKDIAVKGSLGGYYIVDLGDYVYNPRISSTAPVGPISKNKLGKGIMSPLYTVFRFDRVNDAFYEQFFKSSRWHHYLKMISNSGARHDRMSISADDFVGMPVPILDENEQQKIADCLSSLDELLTAHCQKLEALKAHKKGLMQQLFPAEGETVPKLRFAEFRGKEEWAETRLSNIVQLISGLHLSPSDHGASGATPYFTGPSDFTNKHFNISKWTSNSSALAIEDDILITVKGSGVGQLWYLLLPSVAIGRQLMAIRSKQCISSFLYQFLSTKKSLFEVLGAGNMIPGLSRPVVLGVTMRLPSLQEQQKIADCLSSVDELITAQIQKIESLKLHKKGLMQQLFPSVDEIDA